MVSRLTDSNDELLGFILAELTGNPSEVLVSSRAKMLAEIVSEITGSTYSHLYTSEAELNRILFAEAVADGVVLNPLTMSYGEMLEQIFLWVESGSNSPPDSPPSYTPSLDFSDARNSQYIALVLEDI